MKARHLHRGLSLGRRGALALAALLTLLSRGGPADAEIKRIWALDDGTKIKATATSHPLAAGNGVFDGSTIKLFAARNETVAFQVIIEGGAAATSGVTIRLAKVGDIVDQNVSEDAATWYVGRRIELFKQHYFEIKSASLGLVWASGGQAAPKNMLGWVPDALIPLRTADTFDVPAGRNQGTWVDIYVPKGTKPGVHEGTLVVEVDGQPCSLANCQIPLQLTVFDAELADDVRAKTMVYFSAGELDRDHMPARYFDDPFGASAADVQTIRDRHYQLARRHRLTLILGKIAAPDEALRRRVSGELFEKAAGYDGPGLGLGQDIYSISTYGGTLDAAQGKVWSDFFAKNAPDCLFFLYTWDEPWSGDYALVNKRAKDADPVKAFVTASYTSQLDEVDIFAALAEVYDSKTGDAGRQAGKHIWVYNGYRPYSGSFASDDVAVATRVNPWLQYKYDIPRWFYWDSTYYNDFQGGRGQINVFVQPQNFSNSLGHKVNGDGLLIYPGRDRVFPAEDRGFDMPLPSIRLKNWRRGIEDVEYLVLAEKAGKKAEALAIVDSVLPKGFRRDVGSANQPPPWSEDGEKWLEARRKLALLIGLGAQPGGDGGAGDAATGPDGGSNGDGGRGSGDGGGGGDEGCCAVASAAPRPGSLLLFALLVGLLRLRRRRRRPSA